MDKELAVAALQERIAELGESPKDHGTIELIVSRPGTGERVLQDQAELSLVEGLVGDNWLVRGSSRTEDGKANPDAQITLMNSRTIQAMAQEKSRWALAGDQLFVDLDLSIDNLPPGQRIAIGSAVIEITELPHTGCGKFTERFGSEATRVVNSPEGKQQRRRGVNAKVVQPGTFNLGDKASKL